jgi:hypothetical protein
MWRYRGIDIPRSPQAYFAAIERRPRALGFSNPVKRRVKTPEGKAGMVKQKKMEKATQKFSPPFLSPIVLNSRGFSLKLCVLGVLCV